MFVHLSVSQAVRLSGRLCVCVCEGGQHTARDALRAAFVENAQDRLTKTWTETRTGLLLQHLPPSVQTAYFRFDIVKYKLVL